MSKRSRVRSSMIWSLLIALVLPILAACGGTGGGTTATAPATGGNATASAPTSASVVATAAPEATAATQPTTGTTGSTDGKILRVHVTTFPENLDPQQMSTSNEIGIAQLNYEGLTKLDKDLNAAPAAAEKWAFNEAGDEITFTLREGLKYSDGSPLTAANFVYAVERTCDPATAGQYQSILFEIVGCADFASTAVTDTAKLEENRTKLLTDGVTAPDDRTLVLKLTQPAPYYPYIASLWVFYPVKKEMVEKGGADWWRDAANHLGNGPFQLTRLEEDQIATFQANTNYWAGKPNLDGFEYIYQKNTAVAIEAFKAGQLDIVTLINDPTQIPGLKADPELGKQVLSYSGANTFSIGFNLKIPPFEDKKVREAFAYAFDRETFCEVIRSGDCVPAYSWIPEGVAGALESDAYKFDPEKAKQALAESTYGSADKLPEIKLSFNSDDSASLARVEWVASQLREILGIEAVIDPVEGKTINALRKANDTYPQVCLFCNNWFQDYPDPQNWISVYWRSDAFAKRVAYASDKLDDLSRQGDVELDQTKRAELYKQANQVLIDDLPAPFVYHRANVFLVKPYVTGYSTTSADAEWPGERGSILSIDITK
ncbi:MAG: ABC transporter substrate-binding protein [Roseiflexaceae bacterium]